MAPIPNKSGVLLVHPRLRSPNKSNAETFYRWTKLHYKDLLDIPADASSHAKINACVRGIAFDGATDYSHEEKPGLKPAYMYTCFVDDIGILKSQPYYDVSRKLNLEQTRSLGEFEEPVGYEDKKAMVFDIVDTKFAVYEEVDLPNKLGGLGTALEFELLSAFSSETIIRVNLLGPYRWDLSHANKVVDYLEKSLKSTEFDQMANTSMALYHWAGKEAQPNEHPLIDMEGSVEWMILVFAKFSPPLSPKTMFSMAKNAIGQGLQKYAEGVGGYETDKLFEYGAWEAEGHNRAAGILEDI